MSTIGVKAKYQLTKDVPAAVSSLPPQTEVKDPEKLVAEAKVLPKIPEVLSKDGKPLPMPNTRSSSRKGRHQRFVGVRWHWFCIYEF